MTTDKNCSCGCNWDCTCDSDITTSEIKQIIADSIAGEKADIDSSVQSASTSATNAAKSATDAATSATESAATAKEAKDSQSAAEKAAADTSALSVTLMDTVNVLTDTAEKLQKDEAEIEASLEVLDHALVGEVSQESLEEIGDKNTNYSVQNSTGLFPESSKQNLQDSFNAGRGTSHKSKLMPEFLDEIQFRFFDNVTFPYTIIPYKQLSDSHFQVPLTTIHAVGHSDPVGMNPFAAVATYGVGITEFQQESPSTISGMLTGSISMMIRVDKDKSPALIRSQGLRPVKSPDAWLCLTTNDGSPLNARDRYAISNVYNWGQIKQTKMEPQNWAIPLEDYEAMGKLLVGNVTPVTHSVVSDATIAPNSIAESLVVDVGSKTTSWMTIGGENFWYVSDVGGTGNRGRLQWKDEAGNIWYDSEQSVGDESAAKLWKIPLNAQQARIAFKQNANNTTTNIVVLPVPASIDPTFGTWAEYTFNVNQIVDFIPNVPYGFSIAFWNSYGGSHDENGFVVVSGGLKFTYNSREDREKFLKGVETDDNN